MIVTRRPSTLRVLVWVMRFLGLYCFKTSPSSASAKATEISLPFLLWAIFVKAVQISNSIGYVSVMEKYYLVDVGALVTFLIFITSSLICLVTQILLLINGPILVGILRECEEEPYFSRQKSVTSSCTIFSTERTVSVLYYCSCAAGFVVPFIFLPWESAALNIEIVLFFIYTTSIFAGMVLLVLLFREVLTIASQKLNFENNLNESVLEGDDAGLGRRLNVLEKTMHKVSTEMTTFLSVVLRSLPTLIHNVI